VSAQSPSHVAIVRDAAGVRVETVATTRDTAALIARPLLVGICGTDLQILDGFRPDRARILGHEGVAAVVSSPTPAFAPGDLVVFNPVDPDNQDDVLGHSRDGLLQERVAVSPARQAHGMLLPLRPEMPVELAPLTEPLATVLYAHELVRSVLAPQRIAVVGAGAVGLLHCLVAEAQGLAPILVTGSTERLEWVVGRGYLPRERVVVEGPRVAEVAGGVDAVFVSRPRPWSLGALELALGIVRDGGCVDLVGGFRPGDRSPQLPGIDPTAVRRANVCGRASGDAVTSGRLTDGRRVHLIGHRGTSHRHLDDAMQLLARAPQLFAPIVSHVVSVRDAAALLDEYRRGGGLLGGAARAKVLVDFDGTHAS
jgi:2-epi-valiolone-7-phosphate 1-reductase